MTSETKRVDEKLVKRKIGEFHQNIGECRLIGETVKKSPDFAKFWLKITDFFNFYFLGWAVFWGWQLLGCFFGAGGQVDFLGRRSMKNLKFWLGKAGT